MKRSIDLTGCLNFRDIGGYPSSGGRAVRWRQVFRSDALHHLTADDVARLRDELGLGDVIDLRSSAECTTEGRGPLSDEAMRFYHLPLFDGETPKSAGSIDMTLTDRYFLLAEFAKRPIARVITTLAETDSPAVYHCAAGKDRTGVVSAILLGILDVPDEIIVADYAATQENLEAITERLMASEGYQTMLSALPPDTMHADPETMIGFIERLRGMYGTMADYARSAGVSDASLERLRGRLLANP
jgi:protein-tyrosine phosphatase